MQRPGWLNWIKTRHPAWRVMLVGVLMGALVWALSVPLTGYREPFDSPTYYYHVAMLCAGVLAALPSPRFWWLAVIAIFIGERLYAYVFLPETRNWLLFGVIIGIALFTWLPAAVGALGTYLGYRIRRYRKRKREE